MFYSGKKLNFNIIEKKGFTLIEILFVVAIIGVLAGVAISNIANRIPHYRLRTATRNLVSNMIRAKSQAIAENCSYIACFDLPTNTYTITSCTTSCVAPPTWGPIELSPAHPEIQYGAINFVPNQLTFRSNGMAGQAGNLTLINDRGETYIVTVFITGVIRVN